MELIVKTVKAPTKDELLYEPKVRAAWSVWQAVASIKQKNVTWKIGFAHFDSENIEVGDCVFFSLARSKCDLLIVCCPSDLASRLQHRKFKFTLQERAFVLASLSVIDYIVPYDEETPGLVMSAVNPDIIFGNRVEDENLKWTNLNPSIKVEQIHHPFERRAQFNGRFFTV